MAKGAEWAVPELPFRLDFRVAGSDIDVWGHLNNVAWVRWVQQVAEAHSAAVGFDLARYHELCVSWVVRRHEIEYLSPAYEGDRVTAVTWIGGLGSSSSERRTLFKKTEGGESLVRASTLWVLVDASGRPTRIPQVVRAAFS